jgi:hypothetical protein
MAASESSKKVKVRDSWKAVFKVVEAHKEQEESD